jgi:hypothetical protein
MLKNLFILLFLSFSFNANAFVEIKSNFYGTIMLFGRTDTILNTHNTILFGDELLKLGGFYSYEAIQENTIDTSMGGALRFGESTYFELQAGAFERQFKAYSTLKGKGFMTNLIVGKHIGNVFGFSIITSIKKISSGMDKRTIVKLLPYFGMRMGF